MTLAANATGAVGSWQRPGPGAAQEQASASVANTGSAATIMRPIRKRMNNFRRFPSEIASHSGQ